MAVESTAERAYFFDTNDFGTVANFTTPALGNVDGIFDEETVQVELGGEVAVLAGQPAFTCRTSDITGVNEGSLLTISSADYIVKNRIDDGTGVSTLHLQDA